MLFFHFASVSLTLFTCKVLCACFVFREHNMPRHPIPLGLFSTTKQTPQRAAAITNLLTNNPDHKITTLQLCTFNFVLLTTCFGYSFDHNRVNNASKIMTKATEALFLLYLHFFYLKMVRRVVEACSNQ
jgi:hypothetical protein